LEDALILAAEARRGRTDRAGEAYILDPIRVMLRVNTETCPEYGKTQ